MNDWWANGGLTRAPSEPALCRNGLSMPGFDGAELSAPPASPWTMAVATSIVGAAAGWVIEEIASHTRRRRKRRR